MKWVYYAAYAMTYHALGVFLLWISWKYSFASLFMLPELSLGEAWAFSVFFQVVFNFLLRKYEA